jgi:hypothetical protein
MKKIISFIIAFSVVVPSLVFAQTTSSTSGTKTIINTTQLTQLLVLLEQELAFLEGEYNQLVAAQASTTAKLAQIATSTVATTTVSTSTLPELTTIIPEVVQTTTITRIQNTTPILIQPTVSTPTSIQPAQPPVVNIGHPSDCSDMTQSQAWEFVNINRLSVSSLNTHAGLAGATVIATGNFSSIWCGVASSSLYLHSVNRLYEITPSASGNAILTILSSSTASFPIPPLPSMNYSLTFNMNSPYGNAGAISVYPKDSVYLTILSGTGTSVADQELVGELTTLQYQAGTILPDGSAVKNPNNPTDCPSIPTGMYDLYAYINANYPSISNINPTSTTPGGILNVQGNFAIGWCAPGYIGVMFHNASDPNPDDTNMVIEELLPLSKSSGTIAVPNSTVPGNYYITLTPVGGNAGFDVPYQPSETPFIVVPSQ